MIKRLTGTTTSPQLKGSPSVGNAGDKNTSCSSCWAVVGRGCASVSDPFLYLHKYWSRYHQHNHMPGQVRAWSLSWKIYISTQNAAARNLFVVSDQKSRARWWIFMCACRSGSWHVWQYAWGWFKTVTCLRVLQTWHCLFYRVSGMWALLEGCLETEKGCWMFLGLRGRPLAAVGADWAENPQGAPVTQIRAPLLC